MVGEGLIRFSVSERKAIFCSELRLRATYRPRRGRANKRSTVEAARPDRARRRWIPIEILGRLFRISHLQAHMMGNSHRSALLPLAIAAMLSVGGCSGYPLDAIPIPTDKPD